VSLVPTASPIEWAWTVMALPGLVLSVYNAAGSVLDLRFHWTDGLRPVGWVGLAKVALVLGMCLLDLLSGITAMQTPEPVRPELQDAGDFVAMCLLLMDAMTLGLAIAFFLERRFVVPNVHLPSDRP
jgi:hypothetical protein